MAPQRLEELRQPGQPSIEQMAEALAEIDRLLLARQADAAQIADYAAVIESLRADLLRAYPANECVALLSPAAVVEWHNRLHAAQIAARDALSFESVPISVASELVDQVKILRSEAARAWLPIESAPKDGTHILYSGTADGIIRWVGEGRWIDEEGWWDANVNPHDYVGEQQWPTHWQPLPQPPDARVEGPE